jgi:hypothetical protein
MLPYISFQLCSPVDGVMDRVTAAEQTYVSELDPVCFVSECFHEVVFAGMCTTCSKHMTHEQLTSSSEPAGFRAVVKGGKESILHLSNAVRRLGFFLLSPY